MLEAEENESPLSERYIDSIPYRGEGADGTLCSDRGRAAIERVGTPLYR